MRFATVTSVILFGLSATALEPRPISLPEELSEQLKSFEPSAALYLNDLNSFLIASDDTTEDDEPLLFLMDEKGQVADPSLEVKGITKMTDIESISQDQNGTLYLMSSLGLNKNGKNKEERNFFVSASRKGREIQVKDSVVLRPLLLEALEDSSEKELEKIEEELEEKMDVESHFVRNGELYVGLKEPQPEPGKAVIVKAGSVENIFSDHEVDVKVWKTIDFGAVTGEEDLLSDILPIEKGLLLTTTQEEGPGRLWRLDESTGKLTLLEEFEDLHSEGIALQPKTNSLLVVFDEGEDEALFTLRKGPF
jgi:hypothetical protein